MPLSTPNTSRLPGSNDLWSLLATRDSADPGLRGAAPAQVAVAGSIAERHYLAALDPGFPVALRGCARELFAAGDRSAWQALLSGCRPEALGYVDRPLRVTVVGSRAATELGQRRAHELARALGQQGAIVISGGALGIDAAAHHGALAGNGTSWAVLGSGLDSLYPRRNLPLFAQLLQRGLLVSPFPCSAPPRAQHFPKRNQVMAALCDAVVVIEAGLSSGTRYTADAAARLGRPVFCFPGSPGTLALLQGGARAVLSVSDAQEQLSLLSAGSAAPGYAAESHPRAAQAAPPASEDVPAVSEDAARVRSLLLQSEALSQGRDISELSALSGLPVATCAAAVIELELSGCCSRLPGGRYMGRASL